METARYLRYILIGNRKILVEQSEGDKYRSVTEDIAVKQSVEGIMTEECVLAITNDGLFVGSSVGVETHITPSEFTELTSGISTSHSVVGHAYITRMPSVKSGMPTHHSVKGISTATKLGEAGSGIVSTNEAKGKATHSRLTKASDGIGAESRDEAFLTAESKFAEGNSGISAAENIEAKSTEAKLSQVQSGVSAGQIAEGISTTQYTIYAGKYASQTSFTEVPDLDYIYVNGYVVWEGTTYPFRAFRAYDGLFSTIGGTPESPTDEAWGYLSDVSPDVYTWDIQTDDATFTLTESVNLTAEEYAAFNNYFKSVATKRIRAGDYYGKSNYTFNQSYFNTVMTVSSDVIVSFTRSGLSYQRNGLYLYKTSSLNSYGFGVGSGGYTNICSWSPEVTQTITWNYIADRKISLDRDIYTNDRGYEIFFGVFSTQAN